MADPYHEDQKDLVLDLVEDSIVPGPEAVEVVDSFQPLGLWWARVISQDPQLADYLALNLGRQGG